MDVNSTSTDISINSSNLDNFTRALLVGKMTTITLPTIYLFVFLVGLPSSLLALWMSVFRPGDRGRTHPRTSTSIYVLNLAAVDFLYVVFLPLQIVYHFGGNHWPFGRFLCHLMTTLLYLNTHCSIFFLTCVSVDRYLAVVRPQTARNLRTPRVATGACVGVWSFVLLLTGPLHAVSLVHSVPELSITTCYDVFPKSDKVVTFFQAYCIVFFIVVFLAPFSTTVFCYLSVIRTLLTGGGPQGKGSRVRRRAIQLSIVVLLTFIICFAPCNLVLITHSLLHRTQGQSGLYGVYKLCLALSSLNTCFDPFVYYLVLRDFRRRIAAFLCPWLVKEDDSSTQQDGMLHHRTQEVESSMSTNRGNSSSTVI
uniref:proteinase-activated receptor 2-like n=1 Tax=Myxine glutinosa TaxID=7769 RepID=UPI00358E250D